MPPWMAMNIALGAALGIQIYVSSLVLSSAWKSSVLVSEKFMPFLQILHCLIILAVARGLPRETRPGSAPGIRPYNRGFIL
jgi:hypothetical protein